MFLKLGLIVLVLVFGAACVASGVAMSSTLKQSYIDVSMRLKGLLSKPSMAATKTGKAPSSVANTGKAALNVQSQKSDSSAIPVPSVQLMLPLTLPESGQYGLKLGEFSSKIGSDSMAEKLKELHLPTVTLQIADQLGRPSTVLALGPYKTPALAQDAEPDVNRVLHRSAHFPVILLPAATKPA